MTTIRDLPAEPEVEAFRELTKYFERYYHTVLVTPEKTIRLMMEWLELHIGELENENFESLAAIFCKDASLSHHEYKFVLSKYNYHQYTGDIYRATSEISYLVDQSDFRCLVGEWDSSEVILFMLTAAAVTKRRHM